MSWLGGSLVVSRWDDSRCGRRAILYCRDGRATLGQGEYLASGSREKLGHASVLEACC